MSEHPIQLVVSDDLQRDRLTVFFRALLSIPHFIWLLLWSIAALFAAIANWFATLALGRSPKPLHRFLAAYVKYVTQFYAYLQLAANEYPSFDGPDGYAIDLTIAPPARQNRWSVAFRGVLLLPAALIAGALVGDPSSGFNSGRGSLHVRLRPAARRRADRLVRDHGAQTHLARSTRRRCLRAVLRRAVLGLCAAAHRPLPRQRPARAPCPTFPCATTRSP